MSKDLNRAIKQIKLGKDIALVRDSLSLHFKEVDYQNWYKTQQDNYYAIFPTDRVMTDAEKLVNDTDADGNIIIRDAEYVYPQVPIEYITTDEDGNETRTPTDYVTLDEYIKETTVVTPAVEEVPATYDSKGVELTPYIPAVAEVTKLVREFIPKVNYTTEIDAYLANSTEYMHRLKEEKEKKLNKLVVTANTILYNADGKALGNMASVVGIANWSFNQLLANGTSALDAYDAVYKSTTVNWRGADNTTHSVQVESICEALKASMVEIAVVLGV